MKSSLGGEQLIQNLLQHYVTTPQETKFLDNGRNRTFQIGQTLPKISNHYLIILKLGSFVERGTPSATASTSISLNK